MANIPPNRARSRTPPREGVKTSAVSVAGAAFKAAMAAASALKQKVQGKLPVAAADPAPQVAKDAPAQGAAEEAQAPAATEPGPDEAAAEEVGPEPGTPEEPPPEEPAEEEQTWSCHGCHASFSSLQELRVHALEAGERCNGPAWQAAVNAIGCMPGAGSVLWCPACPDSLLGKWTGPTSKASALLRHAVSASKASSKDMAPKAHAWFLAGLVDLLLCSPPPPPLLPDEAGAEAVEPPEIQQERLQVWIESSPPLMHVVGPLLAKPRSPGSSSSGDRTSAAVG
ncbi:unnamed protein product [Symbiodinium natans]|uniref:Uncharacterized protein n=1 Tax=Symbiodinium natans TaxID=878477 RepID=A0A812GXZ0_9DINO|nr:unnamed protein product [Symbiodinium natans]